MSGHKSTLLVVCAVIALPAMPLILGRVPPSGLHGVRMPRTVADPDLWYRVNRFGGWALLIASLVSASLLVTGPSAPDVLLQLVAPQAAALVVAMLCLWHA